MDLENYNSIVMDFQNLMSCIKCHEDSTNIPIILETLKTIVDICTNEDVGRDAFREEGGLEFLMELVSTTDSTILLEHSLKTLAFVTDENVHSQMHVTKKEYFLILQAIVQKSSFPPVILKNSLLLTSSILFQNSLAQGLLSEIGFLQDIIKLFEQAASFYICSNFSNSVLSDSPVDILISANSALCFAVNNPQNERNQEACSVLFPLSLKLFESSSDMALSGSLSSFLSLCVASNVKSQQKFADADGLFVIKRSFQKYYDLAVLDVAEFHSVVSKCTVQSLSNLIGIITAVVWENEKNAAILAKLGVLTLMIKLLITGIFDDKLKTRIILALAYCIDACGSCKSYVLQFDNFHSFLKNCFQNGNPELVAASKYLLQVFLNGNDNLSETDSLQHEQLFPSVSDRCSMSKLKTEKFPAKKSVIGGSVRSIITSKECRHSGSKRKFLSNTPDYNDFIKHSQTQEMSGPAEKCTDRINKGIFEEGKIGFQSFDSNSLMFQPSIHSNFNPFKSDNTEHYRKSPFSHTPSVKSYRNCKKENIFLVNNDSCSLQRRESKHFGSKEVAVKQSSLISSDSDASSQNFKDSSQVHSKKFGITSPKHQIKDSYDSRQGDSTNLTTFKKHKSTLSDKTNTDQGSYKQNIKGNTSIKPQKNYYLKYKSNKNISESMVNSFKPLWNTTKKKDIYSEFSEDLLKSRNGSFPNHKNLPVGKMKNSSEVIAPEADFSTSSLHNAFQFPSSNNFMEAFGSGLSGKTNCSKNDRHSIRHKKRKMRKNNIFASPLPEELNSSSLNLNSDHVIGNNMQVIVLPGDCCEQHKLIASCQLLKVKPLKDAVLTVDQC